MQQEQLLDDTPLAKSLMLQLKLLLITWDIFNLKFAPTKILQETEDKIVLMRKIIFL